MSCVALARGLCFSFEDFLSIRLFCSDVSRCTRLTILVVLRPRGLNSIETQARFYMYGFQAIDLFEPLNDEISIMRIQFNAVSMPAGLFSREQCGAAAGKRIQNDAASF